GFVIGDTSAFPGPLSLLPIGGAILVILAGGAGRTGDLLRSGPMQWLGRIAYPLYLWHWPLLILIAHATGNWDVPAWLGVAVILLSLALADATRRFVAKPMQELGPRRTADAPRSPAPKAPLLRRSPGSWLRGCSPTRCGSPTSTASTGANSTRSSTPGRWPRRAARSPSSGIPTPTPTLNPCTSSAWNTASGSCRAPRTSGPNWPSAASPSWACATIPAWSRPRANPSTRTAA